MYDLIDVQRLPTPLRWAPMPTEVLAASKGCQAFLSGSQREADQRLVTDEALIGDEGIRKKGLQKHRASGGE